MKGGGWGGSIDLVTLLPILAVNVPDSESPMRIIKTHVCIFIQYEVS